MKNNENPVGEENTRSGASVTTILIWVVVVALALIILSAGYFIFWYHPSYFIPRWLWTLLIVLAILAFARWFFRKDKAAWPVFGKSLWKWILIVLLIIALLFVWHWCAVRPPDEISRPDLVPPVRRSVPLTPARTPDHMITYGTYYMKADTPYYYLVTYTDGKPNLYFFKKVHDDGHIVDGVTSYSGPCGNPANNQVWWFIRLNKSDSVRVVAQPYE